MLPFICGKNNARWKLSKKNPRFFYCLSGPRVNCGGLLWHGFMFYAASVLCGFSYSIMPPTPAPHTYIILCHPGWITFLWFTASLNRKLSSLSVLRIDWFLLHNRGAGPHSSLKNGGRSVLTYHMQGRRQRRAVYLYNLEAFTYVIFCFHI